tara:strand:+ start:1094 stop:1207 length:114 start_codon:yes stop_codon:yes gene_type:complete
VIIKGIGHVYRFGIISDGQIKIEVNPCFVAAIYFLSK